MIGCITDRTSRHQQVIQALTRSTTSINKWLKRINQWWYKRINNWYKHIELVISHQPSPTSLPQGRIDSTRHHQTKSHPDPPVTTTYAVSALALVLVRDLALSPALDLALVLLIFSPR